MTTAVKTPAPPVKATPPAPVRKPRSTLPPVDFADVVATDGGVVRQDRKTALDGTPVRGWVAGSRNNGNKTMTIAAKTPQVDTLKSLIQRAAQEIGCGVKFGTPIVAIKDRPGYSALVFATKDRANVDMSDEAVAARKAKRAATKAAKEAAKAAK